MVSCSKTISEYFCSHVLRPVCFQVQTLETDPSRSDEASAEEVIVDIIDFMAVKLQII
jgi:hypothetical protein